MDNTNSKCQSPPNESKHEELPNVDYTEPNMRKHF